MKVAIPAWAGKVSTVFDFAHSLLLVEVRSGKEVSRSEIVLDQYPSMLRAVILSRFDVEVLICGAISRPLAGIVTRSGIEIIPFVTGRIDDVLDAFLNARLADSRLLLPGCPAGATKLRRRQRRFRRGQRGADRGSGRSYHEPNSAAERKRFFERY
ncbi:MAG: NifB/NifX family molybdenum-iron cluster-binding protein [Deltaproteobacteria bacterium]|nr:NifB/NifX family molybdenum-iron cluster-binding protein [Deltaproteobacteria bacterium]